MAFKTVDQIAAEMVASAQFLNKGKVDPFDHCPVVVPRFYFPVRSDVTIANGAKVAAAVKAICKNPAKVEAAMEAIAHFAMPRGSHDDRDGFKKSF